MSDCSTPLFRWRRILRFLVCLVCSACTAPQTPMQVAALPDEQAPTRTSALHGGHSRRVQQTATENGVKNSTATDDSHEEPTTVPTPPSAASGTDTSSSTNTPGPSASPTNSPTISTGSPTTRPTNVPSAAPTVAPTPGIGNLRGQPGFGPWLEYDTGGSGANSCGVGVAMLDAIRALTVARCRSEDGALEVRVAAAEESNISLPALQTGTSVVVASSVASIEQWEWSPQIVAMDGATVAVAYRADERVLARVIRFSQDRAFHAWGAVAQLTSPNDARSLQLQRASGDRLLLAFVGSFGRTDQSQSLCSLIAIGSRVEGDGVGPLDAESIHNQTGPVANLVRLLITSEGDRLAVTLHESAEIQNTALVSLTPLLVSSFQVLWGPTREVVVASSGPLPLPAGPVAVAALKDARIAMFMAAVGGGILATCGSYLAGASIPFTANLKSPAFANESVSQRGDAFALGAALLHSGALLVLHDGAPEEEGQRLRFARCIEFGGEELLLWGPAEHITQPGPGSIAAEELAPSNSAYSHMVVSGPAGLRVISDLRCDAPDRSYLYDVSLCGGMKPTSVCELSCTPAAVDLGPAAFCHEDAGVLDLSGCIGPRCTLPAKLPQDYDVTDCDTSQDFLGTSDCMVKCSSGSEGALALCKQDGGEFQLAGCTETYCMLPNNVTGYDVRGCDTSSGALPAYRCIIACADGFAESVGVEAEVLCNEGEITFQFSGCYPQCKAPIGVDKALDPSCVSGSLLAHLSNCDTQCQPGYSPYPPRLTCNDGLLRPFDSFECQEDSCASPSGIQDSQDPPCEAGYFVLPANPCITLCLPGYSPTVESLFCKEGTFEPPVFACVGNPCAAPVGINAARAQPCAEGMEILHGNMCTAQCLPGHTPQPAQLLCFAEQLQPRSFVCGAECKAPQDVDFALSPSCELGPTIKHMERCVPRCQDGYAPLVGSNEEGEIASLLCQDGTYEPPRFTCAAGTCAAPQNIAHGSDPACLEGWIIGHGDKCTPACERGYSPSVGTLTCQATILTPATFLCEQSSCTAPEGIDDVHLQGVCAEGSVVPNGQTCTPRCRFGHFPSVSELRCKNGMLEPSVFECRTSSVLTSGGSSSFTLAPFARSHDAKPGHAVLVSVDWELGLFAKLVRVQSGAVVVDGTEVPLEPTDADVLAGSLVLLPDAENCILVYLRHSTCGTGGVEAVARVVGSASQGLTSNGRTASRIVDTDGLVTTLAAAWFGTTNSAVVAGTGFAFVCSITAGGAIQISSSVAFESDLVESISVAAFSNKDVVVAYVVQGGCARSRRGQLSGASLQWSSAAQPVVGCSGNETGTTGVSLAALSGQRAILAVSLSTGRVSVYIGAAHLTGMDWQSVEAVPTAKEITAVISTVVDPTGAAPTLVVGYRTQTSMTMYWFSISGSQLSTSSVSASVSAVASSSPSTLLRVGQRAAALLYGSSAEGLRVSSVLVLDLMCSAPTQHEGYDTSGCGSSGSLVRVSQCFLRCAHPYSGTPQAECQEDGGIYVLRGCRPACQAPAVAFTNVSSCLEGTNILAGTYCTASCLWGRYPSRQSLFCSPESNALVPQSFTCEGQGCAAPTCIENAGSPSCSAGWHVPHDTACLPVCAPGFAPSEAFLFCHAGMLRPSRFACARVGIPCEVPRVAGSANPPCAEGSLIGDGFPCSPRCRDEGALPTVAVLECRKGVLSPPFFECASPCAVPATLEHAAAPPCEGGALLIGHGQVCQVQCQFGYKANPSSLRCDRGALEGNGFYSCELTADSCAAPSEVYHLNVGRLTTASSEFPGFHFCQEGAAVAHGARCHGLCSVPLFSASPSALTCSNGDFFPAGFECGRTCDTTTALGDISSAQLPPCTQGSRIDHGTSCTPSCVTGYQADVNALACYDGLFTPSVFKCNKVVDGCEGPTGIEEAATPNVCIEGTVIPNGGTCTPQCSRGFLPTVQKLYCSDRILDPHTFQCVVECLAPVGIIHSGRCIEGSAVADGFACTTVCDSGYQPSVHRLQCVRGVFQPPSFECRRICIGTIGVVGLYSDLRVVENAGLQPGGPACEEGSEIESGDFCTSECADGFVPSEPSLECTEGVFTPATFLCVQGKSCSSPTGIAFAAAPSCVGGQVKHNSTCAASCVGGFIPSIRNLRCWNGELTPHTFECNAGCTAPTVANADRVSCSEGEFVVPGQYCFTRCRSGYSPTIRKLKCSQSGSGNFLPASFECGQDCGTPEVQNAAASSPCVAGTPVKHADVCILNCRAGFWGDGELLCDNGAFVPVGRRPALCLRGCHSPGSSQIPNALSPGCKEGSMVPHGQVCTTQCAESYRPFTRQLQCYDGALTPASFECMRDGYIAFSAAASFSDAAASVAQVVSLNSNSVVVAFVVHGTLYAVVGRLAEQSWAWGPRAIVAEARDNQHDFLARVVGLGSTRFLISFVDRVAGKGKVRLGMVQPYASLVRLGCSRDVFTGSVQDHEAVLLESQEEGRVARAAVAYLSTAGRVVLRVGTGMGTVLAMRWTSEIVVVAASAKWLSVCALDFHAVAVSYQVAGATLSSELSMVRIISFASGSDVALGPVSVLNDASTLHVSLATLNDRRFVVSFNDVRAGRTSASLVVGRVSEDNLTVEWGERVQATSHEPALLVALTRVGPVLAVSGSFASWYLVQSSELALGAAVSASSAMAGPAAYDPSGAGALVARPPVGSRIDNSTVFLLFPGQGQVGPAFTGHMRWTCMLPALSLIPGYITSGCDTSTGPLSAADCKVSCRHGYDDIAGGPLAQCPPPPLPATFTLSGCSPRPCAAPAGVVNAMQVTCAEGHELAHGTSCHPQCQEGFVPSEALLECNAGTFTPETFACMAKCCGEPMALLGNQSESQGDVCVAEKRPLATCRAPTDVSLAANPTCVEGEHIRSLGVCTPACRAGYRSSASRLACDNGALTPSTFECLFIKPEETTNTNGTSDDAGTALEVFVIFGRLTMALASSDLQPAISGMRNGDDNYISGLEVAFAGFLSNLPPEQLAISVGLSEDASARLLQSTTSGRAAGAVTFLLDLTCIAIDDDQALRSMIALEEALEADASSTDLEAAVSAAWEPLLGGAVSNTSVWIALAPPAGINSSAAFTMQLLSKEVSGALPNKLQKFLASEYPSLIDIVEPTPPPTVEEKQSAFAFLEAAGPLAEQVEAAHDMFQAELGPEAGILVFLLTLLVIVLLLVWCPPCSYFYCCVRRRTTFSQGNVREMQFRALYVIPESHRYQWQTPSFCRCPCRCRKAECTRNRCPCCGCCRRRNFCYTVIEKQWRTAAFSCLCPCFRLPETWHVAGVASFWKGFAACVFCPVLLPCIGLRMRMALRRVFGMKVQPMSDACCWFFCCCCAATQEALHVDGAARAVVMAQQKAKQNESKIARRFADRASRRNASGKGREDKQKRVRALMPEGEQSRTTKGSRMSSEHTRRSTSSRGTRQSAKEATAAGGPLRMLTDGDVEAPEALAPSQIHMTPAEASARSGGSKASSESSEGEQVMIQVQSSVGDDGEQETHGQPAQDVCGPDTIKPTPVAASNTVPALADVETPVESSEQAEGSFDVMAAGAGDAASDGSSDSGSDSGGDSGSDSSRCSSKSSKAGSSDE